MTVGSETLQEAEATIMKRKLTIFLACLLLAFVLLPVETPAQTCKQAIVATAPDASFTTRDDGTATHKVTGLVWMRCSLGQKWDGKTCVGAAEGFSWGSALQAADRHSFAGQTDWRLPNKNELETIFEESCHSPAINERVFPATPPTYFWTSSPYAGLATGAWSLDFGYGSANASVKSGSLNVRLVRGGR
jgi:hypothetical protein